LQGCKNVVEQNSTNGVPAPSARPTAGLRNPNRPIRAVSVNRLLDAGFVLYFFLINTNSFLYFYRQILHFMIKIIIKRNIYF
jgi:hypothetical protein